MRSRQPFAKRPQALVAFMAAGALLAACSGGGGGADGGTPAPPPAPSTSASPAVRVSPHTPFAAACGADTGGGTVFANAEVEPHVAANPRNPNNLIAAWQQDRWSNGGAQGLASAVSFDGGATWAATLAPFSRCSGGTAANGGDYQRATDPWIAFAADGTAYQMALSLVDDVDAMLVSRSTDGGRTWSNPATLIRESGTALNDKNTITADRTDARFAYAVWDRLETSGFAPTQMSRTTDGGASWEPAKTIYAPKPTDGTIGNLIVSMADGTLLNVFMEFIATGNNTANRTSQLSLIRSTDRGVTWSVPIKIANALPVGTRTPQASALVRDGSIVPQAALAPNGDVLVVWQDSRFSNGVRDGIALSRSRDAGLTWSAPVRINGDGNVSAFVPGIHVLPDGTIGVTYYDFRSDTPDATTALTDYWLAQSKDGATWTETRVADAFDINIAPNARGLFLGDYMGLTGTNDTFVPVYVTTNADLNNRSDVFARRIRGGTTTSTKRIEAASADGSFTVTSALQERVNANVAWQRELRIADRNALRAR